MMLESLLLVIPMSFQLGPSDQTNTEYQNRIPDWCSCAPPGGYKNPAISFCSSREFSFPSELIIPLREYSYDREHLRRPTPIERILPPARE
ncbi:hypothetical protein BDR05DRAFT_191768 [Suillus weaverae]|nr:hypothetical protein BDR05DRAFT_191768 [Suillus weaverae]